MSEAFDVFISYSRNDTDRVLPWVHKLQSGSVKPFFDTDALVGGDDWREAIVDAIDSSRLMIFIASRHSFASKYALSELSLATERDKKVLPVFLEDVSIPKKFALQLALAHRVNAFDRTDAETWELIHKALRSVKLEWAPPAPAPVVLPPPAPAPVVAPVMAPMQEAPRRRAVAERFLHLDDPSPSFVKDTSGTQLPVVKGSRRGLVGLTGVFLSVATAGVMFLRPGVPAAATAPLPAGKTTVDSQEAGFAPVVQTLGPKVVKAIPYEPTLPEVPEVPPEVPAEVPSIAESMPQVVKRLTKEYFAAPELKKSQAELLSDPVDYFGRPSFPLAQVRKAIADYGRRWPVQKFTITSDIEVSEIEDGDTYLAETWVNYEHSDGVVKQSGVFASNLTIAVGDGKPRITGIAEVEDSRRAADPVYLAEGQKAAAIAFVTKAVDSGNSDLGIDAETIGQMFVNEPVYYGKPTPLPDITLEVARFQSRWVNRSYQIVDWPKEPVGLGTPHVTVTVRLDFRASRPDDKDPSRDVLSSGRVTSEYGLVFDANGHPLIESQREIERQKLPE